MFKCLNCNEFFDEPGYYTECVGEFWGTPAYEEFSCCPYCRDTDFEEYRESEYYDVIGIHEDGTYVELGRFECLEDAVSTAQLEDDNYSQGCSIRDDGDSEVRWK